MADAQHDEERNGEPSDSDPHPNPRPRRRIASRPLRQSSPFAERTPAADGSVAQPQSPAPGDSPSTTLAAKLSASGAASAESWTVGRLLVWTTEFLKRKGAESPRLDAEVLLAYVLDCPRVHLYTHYEEQVRESDRAAYRELLKKRVEGTPVAYLVGRKEFYSLAFKVSPAVLIPRPDSEFVVVEFVRLAKALESPRVVDVGTGSGNLAVACAHQHQAARVFAVDLSPEALTIAALNAETHKLGERISFHQGSLLEPVMGEAPFDIIISNPPYIRTDVIPTLEAGVRLFEPHLALDGGDNGLRVVAALIAQAAVALKPGGCLILEIGSDQEQPVRDLLSGGEWRLAATVRDHADHPRVVLATRTDVLAPSIS